MMKSGANGQGRGIKDTIRSGSKIGFGSSCFVHLIHMYGARQGRTDVELPGTQGHRVHDHFLGIFTYNIVYDTLSPALGVRLMHCGIDQGVSWATQMPWHPSKILALTKGVFLWAFIWNIAKFLVPC
jgi:hypothetical protein